MNRFILCGLTFLIFCGSSIYAGIPDSSRTRDKGTATKERVRKEGTSDEGSPGFDFSNDEGGFSEQCFTSCFNIFFDVLFAAYYSEENPAARYADSTAVGTDIADANPSDLPDGIDEAVRLKKYILRQVPRPEYRIYLNFTLAGANIGGEASEEYGSPAFSYRFNNSIFYKNFTLNLSFSQSFCSGEPLFDYLYTETEGSNIRIIKDFPSETSFSNTGFAAGAGYMADLPGIWGIKFGGGVSYNSIKEETKSRRDVYLNDALQSSGGFTDKLTFSGLYPYIQGGFYIYLNPNASSMLDIHFQYNFLSREPGFEKSTPLDWNKLTGEFIYGIGLSMNIL